MITSLACCVVTGDDDEDDFTLICSVCVCVCDMGRSGRTFFRLLRPLIFPMCKTVTESPVKVGRKCLSTLNDTFTLESQTRRNVCESLLFMEMRFGSAV